MRFKLQEQVTFDAIQKLTEKKHKKRTSGCWFMPLFFRDPAAGIEKFNHNMGHDKDNLEPVELDNTTQVNLDNEGSDNTFFDNITSTDAGGCDGGCDGGAGGE